ncbi:MAG: class I SAM-dependent methyltransferase, partial [Ignavibacteriales bacterium]|nr:class I SAM-dependent methyltransferase [Ignavibacteriales bacterium]
FDLSKNLLNVAKRNCELKNIQANFFCADIRKVFLKSKFDLITNLFTSFGYFESDKENFSFIQNAYELLKENGYYVLDYFNENHLRKNLLEKSYKKIMKWSFLKIVKSLMAELKKLLK